MSIKIFIGTSLHGEDDIAEKTLEYSLKKHSSSELECIFMRNNNDPDNPFSGFECSRWATPFSGLRWAIPEILDFKGKAIYMDVDQLNLRDITELYNIDLEGKTLGLCQGRTCVMLIDCEKYKTIAIPIEVMKKNSGCHGKMCSRMRGINTSFLIDKRWNCLDGRGYSSPTQMWHLHFTNMSTQPWKPSWAKVVHRNHQFPWVVALWEKYRDEMLANEI